MLAAAVLFDLYFLQKRTLNVKHYCLKGMSVKTPFSTLIIFPFETNLKLNVPDMLLFIVSYFVTVTEP